jgi:hypothetical protein
MRYARSFEKTDTTSMYYVYANGRATAKLMGTRSTERDLSSPAKRFVKEVNTGGISLKHGGRADITGYDTSKHAESLAAAVTEPRVGVQRML